MEDKAVPDPQKFSARIDTLKELYNKVQAFVLII